jgi:hypothetical protein
VRDRRLVDLRNGRTPAELVEWLAAGEPRTVVGLDFAFSFPRWFCEEQGWESAREVWAAVAGGGEELMTRWPFWGRPGVRRRDLPADRALRRTEREAGTPKSVFQIGGAGAVGTGSIRGMPCLLALARRGFSVWPFDEPAWPRVVEIYPRALARGRVNKSRWAERHGHLFERFADQPAELLERAAGSEDAFDAAVSALVMARHRDELKDLPSAPPASRLRLEGAIWTPRENDVARSIASTDGPDQG